MTTPRPSSILPAPRRTVENREVTVTIKRIWHGWTMPENAEAYEEILLTHVLPGIEAKRIPGYRGIEVLRQDRESETEFVTVMTFDSMQNVIEFQGEDYRRAYVPDAAQEVLARWDPVSEHYEVRETRTY
jgi:heme-degrading monooxygenase HmoA